MPTVGGLVAVLMAVTGALVTMPDSTPLPVTSDTAVVDAQLGPLMAARRREASISRSSSRSALKPSGWGRAATAMAKRRARILKELERDAAAYAALLRRTQWQFPLTSYRLTASFGASSSLWSSTHTGVDFAAPAGVPVSAVAAGTVTEAGYDGAYGNKTVITTQDGTELWYAHQTSISVSIGESVSAGEVIGTVGATGNVTGPHLHLEVRIAGQPTDPWAALERNGAR